MRSGRAAIGVATSIAALSWAAMGCAALVQPDPSRLGAGDAGPAVDAAGCPTGWLPCGDRCVDPRTDPAACGGCGVVCRAGVSCIEGRCECPATDPACAGGEPLGDPRDCGPLHLRCSGAERCVLGACVCPVPLLTVDGGCVDPRSDPANCGAPGIRCADACQDGRCTDGCSGGLEDCDGACVSLRTSALHCGECGRVCSGDEACVRGSCRPARAAVGCVSCPCEACDAVCCTLAGVPGPVCLDADSCE